MYRREYWYRALSAFPPEKLPGLVFFNTLESAIEDIRDIQADDANPNDCAKQPHEVTHTVDGIRYFCISRVMTAQPAEDKPLIDDEMDDNLKDYDDFMCGGEISESYM